MSEQAPDRIDIYADGCQLHQESPFNEAMSGYGVVVIETQNGEEVSRWFPSGSFIKPKNAAKSYWIEHEAMLRGLEAVKTHQEHRVDGINHPLIVLHTDQIEYEDILSVEKRGKFDPESPLHTDRIKETIQKMTDMGMTVEVTYTGASKSIKAPHVPDIHNRRMDIADKIAKAAAYEARFENQGYLNLKIKEGSEEEPKYVRHTFEGDTARSFVDNLKKIDYRADEGPAR